MLLITGTIHLPPARPADARPAMRAMIAASRAEPGCLRYSYAEDVLEPGLIRVNGPSASRAELKVHSQSAHVVVRRALWAALEIGDYDLRRYEIGASEAT